jgi:hypothetical protein
MPTYNAELQTGPTITYQMADALRPTDILVTVVGTERLHVRLEAESADSVPHNVEAALRSAWPEGSWAWVHRSVKHVREYVYAPALRAQ